MNSGFCSLDIDNLIGFLWKKGSHPSIWRVKILTFVMNVLFVSRGCCCTFLGMFAKWLKATVSFATSVWASVWNSWAPTGRICVKFDIWGFFENLSRKFKFLQNLARKTCSIHADLCTFIIVYLWIFLRMKNISDKYCRKNQNTHFMFRTLFPENPVVFENVENYSRPRQATDGNKVRHRKDYICMLNEAGNNTSTHNICYFLFHSNNRHGERVSLLRYT